MLQKKQQYLLVFTFHITEYLGCFKGISIFLGVASLDVAIVCEVVFQCDWLE